MPRPLNDIADPRQIMAALAAVLTPNTNLAGSTVLIDTFAPLYAGTAPWPALTLEEGEQSAARIAYRKWQLKLTVLATYYQTWPGQTVPNDTVWAAMDADLRCMKANLEDDPTLTSSGTRTCQGVIHIALSPYRGQALSKGETPFPVPVLMRGMTILVNCLPYLSAQ